MTRWLCAEPDRLAAFSWCVPERGIELTSDTVESASGLDVKQIGKARRSTEASSTRTLNLTLSQPSYIICRSSHMLLFRELSFPTLRVSCQERHCDWFLFAFAFQVNEEEDTTGKKRWAVSLRKYRLSIFVSLFVR